MNAIRVVHSLWQALVNTIPVRLTLFTMSSLLLTVLAVRAYAHVLASVLGVPGIEEPTGVAFTFFSLTALADALDCCIVLENQFGGPGWRVQEPTTRSFRRGLSTEIAQPLLKGHQRVLIQRCPIRRQGWHRAAELISPPESAQWSSNPETPARTGPEPPPHPAPAPR